MRVIKLREISFATSANRNARVTITRRERLGEQGLPAGHFLDSPSRECLGLSAQRFRKPTFSETLGKIPSSTAMFAGAVKSRLDTAQHMEDSTSKRNHDGSVRLRLRRNRRRVTIVLREFCLRDDVYTQVRDLSGGEGKASVAKNDLFRRQCAVLDEPTKI